MQKVLFAAFASSDSADRALSELESHGFNPKDLSVITGETHSTAESATTGAAEGVLTGSVIGGLAGLLAGAGVVPALAGLLIGGPIAAAVGLTGIAAAVATGAMTGAVAGGFIGMLMGLGLSREDAEYYQDTIDRGGVLLGVPVSSATEAACEGILRANQAEQLKLITVAQYRMSSDERMASTSAMHEAQTRTVMTEKPVEQKATAAMREARKHPTARKSRSIRRKRAL